MSSGELVTAEDNSEFLFFQIMFVAAVLLGRTELTFSLSKYWEVAITRKRSSHT